MAARPLRAGELLFVSPAVGVSYAEDVVLEDGEEDVEDDQQVSDLLFKDLQRRMLSKRWAVVAAAAAGVGAVNVAWARKAGHAECRVGHCGAPSADFAACYRMALTWHWVAARLCPASRKETHECCRLPHTHPRGPTLPVHGTARHVLAASPCVR